MVMLLVPLMAQVAQIDNSLNLSGNCVHVWKIGI